MHYAIAAGLDDRHPIPAEGDKLWMPNLMVLAVGQSHLKWLKRLAA
jgi:hypothetical protein